MEISKGFFPGREVFVLVPMTNLTYKQTNNYISPVAQCLFSVGQSQGTNCHSSQSQYL